jgi:hypothetical protein
MDVSLRQNNKTKAFLKPSLPYFSLYNLQTLANSPCSVPTGNDHGKGSEYKNKRQWQGACFLPGMAISVKCCSTMEP